MGLSIVGWGSRSCPFVLFLCKLFFQDHHAKLRCCVRGRPRLEFEMDPKAESSADEVKFSFLLPCVGGFATFGVRNGTESQKFGRCSSSSFPLLPSSRILFRKE